MVENIGSVSENIGLGSSFNLDKTGTSLFDDMLSKMVDALNEVSASDNKSNQLMADYLQGKASLTETMTASAQSAVMIQLAVTVLNQAVSSFKEVLSMQI